MKKPIFYIVDVFAEKKYAGNQLAVFRYIDDFSDSDMQAVAKEMNYSETTFILSDTERDGGYDVRIFTPEEEVPFAGHPTLGTAFVIQREMIQKPVEKINLHLKVGEIPVTINYKNGNPNLLWMQQKNPTFGNKFDENEISQILSIQRENIDNRFPVQEVSTGLPFIIVSVKQLDTVKRIKIDRDRYFKLIRNTAAKAILVFSPETYESTNQLNVRVFADYYGVPEDPATGSANGCLAGYLAHHRFFGENQIDVRVEQGYEIGRPSLLYLYADSKENRVDVHVGGKAIMVAKGEWG